MIEALKHWWFTPHSPYEQLIASLYALPFLIILFGLLFAYACYKGNTWR